MGQLVWFNDENLNRFPDPPRQKQGEHNFIPSCHIQARPQWTLPESQLVDESLEMDDEECEIYIEDLQIVLAEETGDLPAHRMLGYPISIQDGVQLGAEFERQGGRWHENRQNIEREAHNWRLLFQMDSQQPDWIWGDLGKAYFLIRDEDLAARRFDQTFFEFQCH